MDQRGYPVDPAETAAGLLPQSRVLAWSAIAARAQTIEIIPSQVGRSAA